MSYQKGLRGLLSGILRKASDKGLDSSASKDPKKVDRSYKPEKNDYSGSSTNPIILEDDEPKPARKLKRKQTVILKPVDAKGKAVARDTPTSPSYSVGSSSELSTVSTIVAKEPNRPAVHYFCYDSIGPHGEPNVRKLNKEVTIANFNDEDTHALLDEGYDSHGSTVPHVKYKVPRLYVASNEDIVVGSDVTARSVSGYVDQIKNRKQYRNTTRSNDPADRLTMGALNIRGDQEYFFLGAHDLVVMEPVGEGFYDGGIPWAGRDNNVFPFAHDEHLERTPLKNFAWEWIKYTGQPAYRPLHAAPGVQLWLVDYELRRRPRHRRQTEVKGHRQVFYGKGVRFVEVKRRDEEWKWKETRRWNALRQIQMWKEKKKVLEQFEEESVWTAKWPKVGVLACELGDF